MKICFDSVAVETSAYRGIGKYTINQIEAIVSQFPEHDFYYFNYYEVGHVGKYIKESDNLHEIMMHSEVVLRNSVSNKEANAVFGGMLREYIEKHEIDVFYITSPIAGNGPIYEQEWFEGIAVCATFWDLIPWVYKDQYLPTTELLYDYRTRIEMIRWADHLFAISNSAKNDLCSYFGFIEDRITVINGAADERFKPLNVLEAEKNIFLKEYGIKKKYVLCVSGDDYRKNNEGLIRAYLLLPKDLQEQYQLVICCKLSSDGERRLKELTKNSKHEEDIVFTNFVLDKDLLELYHNASIVAFVSKYEGFGLPVMEAYACEIPVVTSNSSSLKEIGEGSAILVNPNDVEDIAAGLEKALLLTAEERAEMIENGKIILQNYSWESVAATMNNVLSGLKRHKRNVSKLAVFTPLPPIPSGISDFSVELLGEVSGFFEKIDVFIDSGYEPECRLPENVSVHNYQEFRRDDYDEVLYQMGNSSCHIYMLDLIKKYPGIVELHDLNLRGLAQYICFSGESNEDLYRSFLEEDYSKKDSQKAMLEYQTTWNKDMVINGYVCNYAKRIIVHSNYSKMELLKKDIGRDTRTIPLFANVSKLEKQKSRCELHLAEDAIIIGVFGIVHSNKRIHPILEACKRLWNGGNAFQLLFVGEMLENSIKDEIDGILESEFANRFLYMVLCQEIAQNKMRGSRGEEVSDE